VKTAEVSQSADQKGDSSDGAKCSCLGKRDGLHIQIKKNRQEHHFSQKAEGARRDQYDPECQKRQLKKLRKPQSKPGAGIISTRSLPKGMASSEEAEDRTECPTYLEEI